MAPTLEVGDIIVVDEDGPAEIGDVVTVRRPDGALVTHRVIEIGADGSLVLRGDANRVADPEAVARDAVVGTVTTFIHRPWSTVLRAATSPAGRMTLLGAILLFLIAPTVLARRTTDETEPAPDAVTQVNPGSGPETTASRP